MTLTSTTTIRRLFKRALGRRESLHDDDQVTAYRLFHAAADGFAGLFIDRYGPGCVMMRHVDRVSSMLDPELIADSVLEATRDLGIRAVFDKPFVRDRSSIAGREDPVLKDPNPIAGERVNDSLLVTEPGGAFEVRFYGGFSTGLFNDQRDNRAHLRAWCAERPGAKVVNLFGYTGGFSVACALGGAEVSTVDVSARYLDWAKRNFEHNSIDAGTHHFARMDAREFLEMARRRAQQIDLIIVDPPTFGSANRSRKIPAWSSMRDYPELLRCARDVLTPNGMIFASTNTVALCEPGEFDQLIDDALGPGVMRHELPARQIDFPEGDAYPVARLLEV